MIGYYSVTVSRVPPPEQGDRAREIIIERTWLTREEVDEIEAEHEDDETVRVAVRHEGSGR